MSKYTIKLIMFTVVLIICGLMPNEASANPLRNLQETVRTTQDTIRKPADTVRDVEWTVDHGISDAKREVRATKGAVDDIKSYVGS